MTTSSKHCFISVGFPENPGPALYDKVLVMLKKNETTLEAAERFRKCVAAEQTQKRNKEVKPEHLYFLIFGSYLAKVPSQQSKNARKKLVSLRVKERYEVSVRGAGKLELATDLLLKG